MITPHGYIDNPTFRGMRWHLRKTFDSIYVLDLHGNSNKKETKPDGSKDENVFDIKTGVSIILGIKKSRTQDKKLAQIYKADLYGLRKEKFELLDSSTIESINWIPLIESTDLWILQGKGKSEYQKGFSVEELFTKKTTGIVTMGDNFIIDADKETLIKRVDDFIQNSVNEAELKSKYNLGKNYSKWIIDNKKRIASDHSRIVPISYRPFDTRYTYFDNSLVWRPRTNVMRHFMKESNVGLVLMRQATDNASYNHILASRNIVDNRFMYSGKGITLEMPLYLYDELGERTPNINEKMWQKINETTSGSTPKNIFDYIYAVLHSPKYREKYKEFLKIDFPRVPYPKDKESFRKLVRFGTELRELHLLESPKVNKFITTYPVTGSDTVDKVSYNDGKVFINSEQYFGKVPEIAWNFYIGGYQPAQKWLKDRKARILTNSDIEHYQKIIVVLTETDRIMKEVDEVKL